MISNSFREKFELERLTAVETKFWILSVRPKQLTKGALVLTYRGEENELGDLPDKAFLELRDLMCKVESFARKRLNSVRINYLVLRLVDNELHFHIFPRFDTTLKESNEEIDPFYPLPVDLLSSKEVSLDFDAYIDCLKVCFNE